ncbi:hypothetical protein E2C01_061114 [Portunus trituberculatus]|uniref:Uncharacterized protein n=1 Tax=Portunus trituberculatus TaxID=210409 RepID=A0A5B7HBE3_PORTR|nr:hypothetical protein [Portunus trituberculatus]
MQGHTSILPPVLPCDSDKELSRKPVIQRRLTAVPRLSLNHPPNQSFTVQTVATLSSAWPG